MKLFFYFSLAVFIGTVLGVPFFGEEGEQQVQISSSDPVSAGSGELMLDLQRVGIRRTMKKLLRPKKDLPEYGPYRQVSQAEVVTAAKKLASYTRVPATVLVAISDQETGFGANHGKTGRAIRRAKSIQEQVLLDVLASRYGLDSPDDLPVSSDAAFGLTQARPSLYLHHTGMKVEFGDTPTVLLHGTPRYWNMSRAERIAGVKVIQREVGLRGSEIDGRVGPATLDAIERAVGVRSFGRVAKYRLAKKYFISQIRIITDKSRDRVWQRICRAEGKDPRKAGYFLPNLFNPLHSLAYASVHIEDDLRLAKGNLGIAIAAYYTGIGDAKEGCEDGLWYRNQVVAKSKRYATDLRS